MTTTPSGSAAGIDAIAVVGIAGRFPGAASVAAFWENLAAGTESITFFTDEQLLAAGVPADLVRHPSYVKAKGVLDGVELFDAPLFGYTPKEAQLMDPQQRIFLECGWHALEDAGYDAASYRGSIGVFAGAGFNQYLLANLLHHPDGAQAIAYDKDFLATRLSYRLNLTGPSMGVQTACSTSLVTVCQACQSLLSFQCDIALAGGVAVNLPLASGYLYHEGSILSPDGHCRPFDARARGTVMGSGVGLVVLRRLEDALADGDRIRAVIRGFAVNNDGAGKMGYMAPSIEGQAQVIRLAHALADVAPESIGYVEAHGTGTTIGDPIEIAALTQAFRAGTARTGFCAIGSVKSNIGHLDSAAGIASLIKTVLALEHRQLPATLHFETPNPKIDFAASPFYPNTRLVDWAGGPTPRRAGVSSFGIGGTNAHLVLEEAPARAPSAESRPWQVLTVSARTEAALETAAADLASHLRREPDVALADTAFTTHAGRTRFPHARAIVCRTADEAATALETRNPRRVLSAVLDDAVDRPIVFMFPGQGAQHAGMAAGLYAAEPAFRRQVDACSEALRPHLGMDIRELILATGDRDRVSERLRDTLFTQAALFVVEYAIARWWIGCGIHPAALIGHSVGEYVAACLSGVLTLDDALMLLVARGRLMRDAPAGAMLAIPLSEARARALLQDGVSLAAVNAPAQCVLAGRGEVIDSIEARLNDEAMAPQRLRTSGAFHSALMDDAAAELTALAARVGVSRPRIPYVSNVTGTWITEADLADPSYWGRHVRETVRFGAGVQTLLGWGARIFLEAGPGHALGGLVRQHAATRPAGTPAPETIASLPAADDPTPDGEVVASALARLWLVGGLSDWKAYHAGERRLRVALPLYPFERKRYWAEPGGVVATPAFSPSARHGRRELDDWFAIPSWSRSHAAVVDEVPTDATWLVLADPGSAGDRLADALEARGRALVRVRTGDGFARNGGGYSIDPASRGDFASLLSDLSAAGRLPGRVLHLWLLGAPGHDNGEGFADACRTLGFDALVHLAQAWGDHAASAALDITVVGDGVHDVSGHDALQPDKATVLGPVRVIPQEYANAACRLVDVPAGDVRPETAALERLVRELESRSADAVVALRGIDRWVQTVEPVRLADGNPRTPIREGGTYLITGGYGAIGMATARALAPSRAKLVLVGRAGVPAREMWSKQVALRGRDDAVRRTILSLQDLEALGAEVLPLRADVADPVQMHEVVSAAKARFGRIDGVIHAAGVPGGGVIQMRDADAIASVMRAKVRGTRVLAEALAGERPDFMVLCSSLASVAGGAGQVDYCAANAYLDAFARRRSLDGALTVAIGWDRWRDGGMAAAAILPSALARAHERALEDGISAAEGAQALHRCLTSGQPHVLVSTSGWRAAAGAPNPGTADVETTGSDLPFNPRPTLVTPYLAPEDDVDRRICDVWREALGVDRVGVFDSFFDLGGHSLLAIQVVARLNAQFGTSIPVAKLYEGLTPAFFGDLVRGGQHGEPAVQEDAADRSARLSRQKQHQEKRRVVRTGQRRLVQ